MTVYFIRAGDAGPVKIGWSSNVEVRRKTLQTSHHEPLRVIRTIEGPLETESWLHERFAGQRLEGEWFMFCEEMLTVEPEAPPRAPPQAIPAPVVSYDDRINAHMERVRREARRLMAEHMAEHEAAE